MQELGSHDADRGLDVQDLQTWLKETAKEGEKKVPFDWEKIDASDVHDGWNSKVRHVLHSLARLGFPGISQVEGFTWWRTGTNSIKARLLGLRSPRNLHPRRRRALLSLPAR